MDDKSITDSKLTNRRRTKTMAIPVLIGIGLLLSACAAPPDYGPAPADELYGSFYYDGGWHDWHHGWDHHDWHHGDHAFAHHVGGGYHGGGGHGAGGGGHRG